jgi:hypothetical protein
MDRSSATRGDRWQAMAMEATAAVIAAYWVDFFTRGTVRSSDDPAYLAFERSFPLADGYAGLCLLLAGRRLRRQEESAVLWGVAGGSALVFLAAMDTLYNVEQGTYADRTPAVALEAGINAATWVLGPLYMARSWRARSRLGG